MEIPLVDLNIQYRYLKDDILHSIENVLDGMQLFLGENVEAFENEFAAFQEVEHAIGVSSGTTALQLALMACGVGAGDEVLTPSHTFIATAEAITLVGAKPVFIDIDPSTYTMDVDGIESQISHRTKAIVPVHIYGQPVDMDPIMELAEELGLWVIEDACQAHGARYKGKRTGSLGHVAAFSFYYSKNLGAYGEAGMVTTGNDDLGAKIRMLRDHGSSQKYRHQLVGLNGRLDEIQAAVLRAKLPYLEKWNEIRRSNAAHYNELLAEEESVICPSAMQYCEHVYHLYVVRVPQRDGLLQHLRNRGIGAGIHYPAHSRPPKPNYHHEPGSHT